jgi:dienelactone hydrolase
LSAQQPVLRKTPSGVEFALGGPKPASPGPVLLMFAGTIAQTLEPKFYPLAERLRAERGFLPVTMDIPNFGADHHEGEPTGLAGWRTRIEKGDDTIGKFVARARSVLDYLIAEKYADPARIYLAGTSRGGFLAFHTAAADPRIRAIITFAPVTDLIALSEFSGLWNHAPTRALNTIHLAARLAGRPIWMCIGNNDDRVNTDYAIQFSRRVVEASIAAGKHPDIEMVLQTSKGHTIAPESHGHAADWLESRFEPR